VPEIVVVGGGGHAKVLISVLKKAGYKILGYTDRQDRLSILATPYLGEDRLLPELLARHAGCSAIVGVGKIDASPARLQLQEMIERLGFRLPAVCSPHCVVNEAVSLGAGTAVFDGAVVNSGTKIGRACIINTNSTVEHDCRIGDNVHMAPGVTISGAVTVGDNCMIGAGATVIHSVTICEACVIGAGATVVTDISKSGIYAGTPARRVHEQ